MQFLIDADLSPRLAAIFAEHGHDAIHVETVFPPRTPDAAIGTYARDHGYCLVTGDYDFSDVREFAPQRFPGIVVLTLPRNAGPEFIASLVREFLTRLPDLGPLRGKLLIVERGRIRIRE